jgi:hypothetical protein
MDRVILIYLTKMEKRYCFKCKKITLWEKIDGLFGYFICLRCENRGIENEN